MVCAAPAGAGRPTASPRKGATDVDGGDSEVRLPLRGQTETAVGSHCTWGGAGADDVGGVGGRSRAPQQEQTQLGQGVRSRGDGEEGVIAVWLPLLLGR